MSMTDPIADMLTRIRNAYRIRREYVDVPASNLKKQVLEVLIREGFIPGVDIIEDPVQATIRVHLKYGEDGLMIIRKLVRASRPGCRLYVKAGELKPVLHGQGISVVSTSVGVLSDREAREKGVGGELLCKVW